MKNASETIEQNASKTIELKAYLNNLIQEENIPTTLLGKIITLPTEIGGSAKLSVGIANPFRTHTANWTDSTIQPTIVHSKKATGLGHRDGEFFPLGSLDSVTDVPRSGRNFDNHTGINPQGHIVNTIPESRSVSNCNISDSARRTSDITYLKFPWHGTTKIGSENLGGKKSPRKLSAKITL